METDLTVPTTVPEVWDWWRAQMPISRKWAYFDHAAVAPLPAAAGSALAQFADQAMLEGDTLWPQWARNVEELRHGFAYLLNCDNAEIAIVPNTSFGINVVAEGLRWNAGDNVVLPAGEFPSNRFPWLNQQRHGVEVRIVGDDNDEAVDEEALLAAIDSRTRIVSASWVGYATGYRINLPRLVREVHRRGALFFLDAIQGLGIFPLDLQETPVDFLAADGHKWLLGPEGSGLLMIRQQRLAELECVPVGWNSVQAAHQFSHAAFDLRTTAARYEIGSQNMAGAQALQASLRIFLAIRKQFGAHAIADRIHSLADLLRAGLRERGARLAGTDVRDQQSGIVTFALPGVDPAVFRRVALSQGVVVSCRGIGVRASVHAYNHSTDIDRLLDVVQRSLQPEPQTHRSQ